MKKLDFLLIKTFIGPFILTTAIVVFIFLMRYLMMYFDQFVGKDLGIDVFARLFGYFTLVTVPTSLPLSTLLAALMCYGSLGEHVELTAMKSAGISSGRIILPVLVLALMISGFAFWYNNNVTPWANLKAYSLLYDIKSAKLTLNINEGIFYREIPGYSIKVSKKYPDGKSLKNVIVYDHSNGNGNKNVTIADSGRMYTEFNNSYLVFELYNGYNYQDYNSNYTKYNTTQFVKNNFKKNKLVVSLESFGMKRTNEDQFKYHEWMNNIDELNNKIDSSNLEIDKVKQNQERLSLMSYTYLFRKPDSTIKELTPGPWITKKIKGIEKSYRSFEIYDATLGSLKSSRSKMENNSKILKNKERDINRARIEKWKKYTQALNCLVMFLIGASLGSIVKKGGLGMPVLLGITFFIVMYVLMQIGEKNAREGVLPVLVGVWMPTVILGIIGLYFLRKSTNDSRLFDSDVYSIFFDKIKTRFTALKS